MSPRGVAECTETVWARARVRCKAGLRGRFVAFRRGACGRARRRVARVMILAIAEV